jgi:GNAT superfamily N-acetyltransferase
MAKKITGIDIRSMSPADIEQAMLLVRAADWNQTPQDWQMLLSTPGKHLVATSDQKIAGTLCALDYHQFIWVAMVLVDPLHQRQGIATKLMKKVLDHYPEKVFRLDATAEGAKVYEPFGYKAVDSLSRWYRESTLAKSRTVTSNQIPAISPADMEAIGRVDASVFGADRRPVLKWFQKNNTTHNRTLMQSDKPAYVFGRPGYHAWQIGPLVADHTDQAETLLSDILQSFPGRPFYLDTFNHKEWLQRLKRLGFKKHRDFVRMQLGSDVLLGIRENQFAIGGPELA